MKTMFWFPLLALAAAGCIHGRMAVPAAPPLPPTDNRTLVQFNRETGLGGWHVENDVVMGGRSQSRLVLDESGNAVFTGAVSLENDGGFASMQCDFAPLDVSGYRAIHLGLKGDGKRYQLRLDAEKNARHSYAADFQTSGAWQEIVLPFADLEPIRHGDRLDLPNYPGQTLARVQLLIGNAKAETFRLEIDRIWLAK
ncbi:MAG: CIA30 family protein [Kiritimatiellia bacterium]